MACASVIIETYMSSDLIERATYEKQWLGTPLLGQPSQRRAGALGSHLSQSLRDVRSLNLLKPAGSKEGPHLAGYGAVIAPPDQLDEPDAESVRLSFSSPQVNVELLRTSFHFAPEDGRITVQAALDVNVPLTIEIAGKLTGGGTEFKPKEIGLVIAPNGDDAGLLFVASTFVALFALSPLSLVVPGIGLALNDLRFDLSPKQIGEQLRTSKTAYKLMVVGRATGNRMDFPPILSGQDLQILTLIYRAIVDRTFDWPLASYPLRRLATPAALESIRALGEPASMTFVRENVSQELLGRLIRLGTIKVFFKQAIIRDRDAFLGRLASESGQEVGTEVIAVDGRATIECADAPRLPDSPWTVQEKKLIALGPHLCDLLASRYNQLAAATLAGLTEEEKAEITARPELDEEAHLVGDED
jgi:hypothetical protein